MAALIEEEETTFGTIEKFRSLYDIQEDVLGEGGYSVVRLATCINNRSAKVAVKIINRGSLDNKTETYLKREVAVMKKLNHSSIVKFYGAFEDTDFYFIVLEYLEGGELFDRISEKVFYNENDARVILFTILEAVKYCHDSNVVHRDLKPENLLLCTKDDDAKLKLADFGFAVVCDGFTITDCCGSPEYMAPEVLSSIPYGKPADMWSLGVILYILLGGYPPFYDTNQQKMFKQIIAGKFEFHKEYWGNVSSEAKDLIMKLLQKDQKKRIDIDQLYKHPWILRDSAELAAIDLATSLKAIKKAQATKRLRVAIKTVIAVNRFSGLFGKKGSRSEGSSTDTPTPPPPPPVTELKAQLLKKKRGSAMVFSTFIGVDAWKELHVVLDLPAKMIRYYDKDGVVIKKEVNINRCTAREIGARDASGKLNAFAVCDSRGLELVTFVASTTIEKDTWINAVNNL